MHQLAESAASAASVAKKPIHAASSPAALTSPSVSGAGASSPSLSLSREISMPDIVRPITGDKKRDVIICKLASAMGMVLEEGSDCGLAQEALDVKATEIEVELARVYGKDPHG